MTRLLNKLTTLQAPLELSREKTVSMFFRLIRPCLDHWSQLQITVAVTKLTSRMLENLETLSCKEKLRQCGVLSQGEYLTPWVGHDAGYKVYHEDDNDSNNKTRTTDGSYRGEYSTSIQGPNVSNHTHSQQQFSMLH